MKNTLTTVAALVLIIGSGLVHGAWTNRWRTSPALALLAGRLESVPTVIGDWTASSQPVSSKQMAIAGAVGHLTRVYTNRKNGTSVSVMLLCGLPGNISTHTPDVCYPGAGYALGEPQAHAQSYGVPQRTRSSRRRSPAGREPIRLDYGFTGPGMGRRDGRRENARWAFATEPYLVKLYVVRETGGAATDPGKDPASEFLALLLPELNLVISPADLPTGPKSSSVQK